MRSVILCEGSTDAILLSYYLNKVSGWEFCKKAPEHLNIKQSEFDQTINWYKRDDDRLLICGVGGKDKMSSFFKEKILSPMVKADAFSKIVLMLDRDDKSTESIEAHASHLFKPIVTEFKNNSWIDNTYVDAFGIRKSVSSLLIVIPTEHQGALETLMLEAIAEDPYDAAIVKDAGDFVDKMQKSASRYIPNNRMRLKAHLGVTWAVQYPEKVFKLIDEQIRSVSWENSEVLRNCFRQLESL
jgi:hypothetical protein